MDNIAHTLAGITLGCALTNAPPLRQYSREPREGAAVFRASVLWTSFVANNLPDVDSAISEIFEPGKLGQLLNQRGFTHSLLFVPLGAVISAVMGIWIALYGWRLSRNRVGAERGFASCLRVWLPRMLLVGAAGALLHLFMEWWNDYGPTRGPAITALSRRSSHRSSPCGISRRGRWARRDKPQA